MVTIKSLPEFMEMLEKLPRKSGSSLYFRGHSNYKYELKPFLFRNKEYIKNEHLMFNEMLVDKPEEFLGVTSTLEKLVKMQHYELPTRLLDITRNPLVALYFTCSNTNKDGEVIVLNIKDELVKYNDSDTVLILSNLCKLKPKEKKFNINLSEGKFNKTPNVGKLIWEIQREKPVFYKKIKPKDITSVIPIKAPKSNERIKIQDGLFLLFGNAGGKKLAEIPQDWVHKDRIIIDASSKIEILKQLEYINISSKTLFPELENTAKTIREKYSSK